MLIAKNDGDMNTLYEYIYESYNMISYYMNSLYEYFAQYMSSNIKSKRVELPDQKLWNIFRSSDKKCKQISTLHGKLTTLIIHGFLVRPDKYIIYKHWSKFFIYDNYNNIEKFVLIIIHYLYN